MSIEVGTSRGGASLRQLSRDEALEWLYRDELKHCHVIWQLVGGTAGAMRPREAEIWLAETHAGQAMALAPERAVYGSKPPTIQIEGTSTEAVRELLSELPFEVFGLDVSESLMGALVPGYQVEDRGSKHVYAARPGEVTGMPGQGIVELDERQRHLVTEAAWTLQWFDALLERRPQLRGFGILVEERLVSRLFTEQISKNVTEMAGVYTPEHYRGRGYATALVHGVAQLLSDAGQSATYTCATGNTAAMRTAEAAGLRHLLTRRFLGLRRG